MEKCAVQFTMENDAYQLVVGGDQESAVFVDNGEVSSVEKAGKLYWTMQHDSEEEYPVYCCDPKLSIKAFVDDIDKYIVADVVFEDVEAFDPDEEEGEVEVDQEDEEK